MKALGNMERIQIDHELMLSLLSVYESKGKEFYYDELFSRDKNVFERKVVEDNVIYLAKYLDLDLTDARMRILAKRDMQSKNKNESLFNNIKEALFRIQKNPKDFELLVNEVDSLTRHLSKNFENFTFRKYKRSEGILATNELVSTKILLEQLMNLYAKQLKTKQYELSQLIANFYTDFMNMEILTSNNDLVGLILVYALLLKNFNVFKYVSFFENFYDRKETFKKACDQAKYYWDTGFPQTTTLSKVLLDTVKECYMHVDGKSYEYSFEKGVNKSDNIENTILKGSEIFTKEDIRLSHPTVSEATIDRTLKRLKDEQIIRPLGKGRSSKWTRLVEGRKKLDGNLDLFSFSEK